MKAYYQLCNIHHQHHLFCIEISYDEKPNNILYKSNTAIYYLTNLCGISVSQMTRDFLRFSYSQSGPSLISVKNPLTTTRYTEKSRNSCRFNRWQKWLFHVRTKLQIKDILLPFITVRKYLYCAQCNTYGKI